MLIKIYVILVKYCKPLSATNNWHQTIFQIQKLFKMLIGSDMSCKSSVSCNSRRVYKKKKKDATILSSDAA